MLIDKGIPARLCVISKLFGMKSASCELKHFEPSQVIQT